MDVLSRRSLSSTLNPNAPLFVPWAYRTVEDFSDQWWALVQSSPCFREFWLQERFHDPQDDAGDDPLFPDDLDTIFDEYDDFSADPRHEEKRGDFQKDLIPIGALKWRKGGVVSESPRYLEKAPKIVSVKVSPRTIHQPR